MNRANKFGQREALPVWHWHGAVRYPVRVNDPRCPICNADGHLGEAEKVEPIQPHRVER